MDVSKTHVYECLQLLTDLWNVFENGQSICDGCFEQISYRLSFVAHLESLMVVTLAATDLAKHIHVGQKIHLDTALPFALASLAPSAAHVERETAGFVSTFPRFGRDPQGLAD